MISISKPPQNPETSRMCSPDNQYEHIKMWVVRTMSCAHKRWDTNSVDFCGSQISVGKVSPSLPTDTVIAHYQKTSVECVHFLGSCFRVRTELNTGDAGQTKITEFGDCCSEHFTHHATRKCVPKRNNRFVLTVPPIKSPHDTLPVPR